MSEGPQVDVDYAATPLYQQMVGKEAAKQADALFNTPTSARAAYQPPPPPPDWEQQEKGVKMLLIVFFGGVFLGGSITYILLRAIQLSQ